MRSMKLHVEILQSLEVMLMNSYVKMIQNLKLLKLDVMMEQINEYHTNDFDENQINLLVNLTNKEIEFRENKAKLQMIRTSSFPKLCKFEEFDFDFNTSIDKNKIYTLCTLDFLEQAENIIFYGSPGTGKTHLSISIGIKAASVRTSTYFIKCKRLLDDLVNAHNENRLDIRLKHYSKYKLLIIDEIGFLPIKELEAKILFQLIDMRYEKKSTIVTTNILLENWDQIFNNPTIANAILDRLLHHSHVIKMIGESYRLRNFQIE